MDAELDYTFPKYNPNPKTCICCMPSRTPCEPTRPISGWASTAMATAAAWWTTRCEVFADKVGVLLARDLSSRIPNAQFVVDVKSTGIYLIDPVLKANGVKVDYWKTGHSYIKTPYRGTEGRRGPRKERALFLQRAARARL